MYSAWKNFKSFVWKNEKGQDRYSATIGISGRRPNRRVTLEVGDLWQPPGDPPQIELGPDEVADLVAELALAWKELRP